MGARRPQGFSLLELLVVLFIVVLVVSLATLNLGSDSRDRRLADSVRLLADLVAFAQDEAQYSGRDIGLRLRRRDEAAETRYVAVWRERWPQGWLAFAIPGEAFGDLEFPPGIELALSIDEVPVDLDAAAVPGQPEAPQMIVFASGELTPGELQWRDAASGDVLWRSRWDFLGRFTLADAQGDLDDPG